MPKNLDRNNRLFSTGKANNFKEAFPEIKCMKLKTKENFSGDELTFDEKNCPGLLSCHNSLCTEGGFELDISLASDIFFKKLKTGNGFILCSGHENMGSRWKTRRCVNAIQFWVEVEYEEN